MTRAIALRALPLLPLLPLLALLPLSGCGEAASRAAMARFTESGVEVTVTVSSAKVEATYRPIRPGFHVYSLDLPQGGVDGLGIPTRLAVRAGLEATGRATANRPVLTWRLPALKVDLPVYPDGPVKVSLPVRRTSGRTAEIVVSYGACGEGTCLAPVRDHLISVELP